MTDFLLFKQLPHQGTGTFEAYHTWMWVPILQEDGGFGGLWNATIDTTSKVLAERRLATVREMGEQTSVARTMDEFNSAVIDILGSNPRDAPFAMLYSVEVESTSDKKDSKNSKTLPGALASVDSPKKANLTLMGKIGVPDGHPSAPPKLSVSLGSKHREGRMSAGPFSQGLLGSPTMSFVSIASNQLSARSDPVGVRGGTPDENSEGSHPTNGHSTEQWPFREALQSRRLVLVEDCASLIEGYPIRIWDELPNAAIVVPIANDSDEGVPSAVLVIGLSIRRPFDEDYESFIHV